MFSGIGGFEVGLQNSKHDFQCVGFSEIDPYAVSIYEKNFPNHINYGDATKIRTEELPDFDFLVGGFPCQAFSVAGKRRGFDDTRGTLFFEIARVLKDKRPRYFLLENVRGLLSHNKGETFQTILEILSNLGYVVQWTLFNSADFQVPQRRERLFIEGYSRRECERSILSVRRNCKKDNGGITDRKLIVEDIPQKVQKRKYDVDIPKLQQLLKNNKTQQGLSNQQIANALNLPLTNVAHWFRTDKYFSIPPKEIWFDLKNLLKIDDDSFDKSITEFIEVDGVYDMNNRVYSDEGLAPTLKCSSKGELIKEQRDTIQLNTKQKTYQDGRVYSHNGLSIAMNARGNNGWYTTDDENEQEVKRRYSKDYELLNGSGDGNIACIDANYHKGLSPSDVKKNRRRRTHIIETKGPGKKLKLRESTKKGYKEATEGDGVELSRTHCTYRRGVSHKDATGALNTKEGSWGTVTSDFRIRKLTPRECERLQAFPDDWTRFGKDGEEISNTQRYKCIGNAVTTTVITHIVDEMFDHEM